MGTEDARFRVFGSDEAERDVYRGGEMWGMWLCFLTILTLWSFGKDDEDGNWGMRRGTRCSNDVFIVGE